MYQDLLAAAGRGARIITANARLARSLRSRFTEQQTAAAWLEPAILPWAAWVEQEWRERLYAGDASPLLAPWQELGLWQAVVRRHPEAGGLIDPLGAAGLAREAWRLVQEWRLPWNAPAWRAVEDAAVFREWAEAYRHESGSLERLDPACLDDFVAEHLAGPAPAEVWLAGFEDLTPRQRAIVARLKDLGAAVAVAPPPTGAPGNSIRVEFASAEREVEAAADWALRRLKAHPEASIGIVFTALDQVRATVDRVFRGALPGQFHVSLGPPLSARPLVGAALNLLELLAPRVEFAPLSSALLSPYVGGAVAEASVRALWEAELRRRGAAVFSLAALADDPRGPEGFRNRLRAIAPLQVQGAERHKPSQWAARFRQLLEQLEWPGEAPLNSDEYQTRRRWRQLLTEFASLDLVWPGLTAPAALNAMRRMAVATEFEAENLGQPVQVMGMLEAAGSSFDHLWIGGASEPAWPPPAGTNPFIPLSLAREHNLPLSSSERSFDHAHRVAARLLASAPAVMISHTARDGDRDIAVSPLFARVPVAPAPKYFSGWKPEPAPLEEFEDIRGPALSPGAIVRGGVNAIRAQAQCPFRAFAEFRLLARPLEEPEAGLDPRTRGELVHRVLEACWREIKTSGRLQQIGEEELTGIIARAVAQALKPLAAQDRLRSLEQQRLEKLIRAWFAMERGRETPFVVEQAEQRRPVELAGLHLDTRIDRADRLPDGSLVLVDYKTSTPSPADWKGGRPNEPQLPIYAVSVAEPLAGVLFGQVRAGESRFVGLAAREGIAPNVKPSKDFAGTVEGWRGALEALALEFQAGLAVVDPKEKTKTCEQCHLALLCRVNEKNMREEE